MSPEQAKETLSQWEIPENQWQQFLVSGDTGIGSHEIRAHIRIALGKCDRSIRDEVICLKIEDGLFSEEQREELENWLSYLE